MIKRSDIISRTLPYVLACSVLIGAPAFAFGRGATPIRRSS